MAGEKGERDHERDTGKGDRLRREGKKNVTRSAIIQLVCRRDGFWDDLRIGHQTTTKNPSRI